MDTEKSLLYIGLGFFATLFIITRIPFFRPK